MELANSCKPSDWYAKNVGVPATTAFGRQSRTHFAGQRSRCTRGCFYLVQIHANVALRTACRLLIVPDESRTVTRGVFSDLRSIR